MQTILLVIVSGMYLTLILQVKLNKEAAWTLSFGAGTYRFEASYNYPQLDQLGPSEVLDQSASSLISQNPDQTTSLSFLSYTDKLLAGTWRFLTYFGRDSMISMLLMQPILSESAIEAVISAVLERVNRTDGTYYLFSREQIQLHKASKIVTNCD